MGPTGPWKLLAAPVKVMGIAPVLRHVGATTAVSLGCSTLLPAASTARAMGATAWLGTVWQVPGNRYVMSSTHTPTSATELSEANRMRMNTSRPTKSAMFTRTSWKARLSPDQAWRLASGLMKPPLIVALYGFSVMRAGLGGMPPVPARMSTQVVPSNEYSRTWPSYPRPGVPEVSVLKRWKNDSTNAAGMFPAEIVASRWSLMVAGSDTNHEWVGEFAAVVTMFQRFVPTPPAVFQYGLPFSTLSVTVALGPPGTALRSTRLVSWMPLLQAPVPVFWLSSARTT